MIYSFLLPQLIVFLWGIPLFGNTTTANCSCEEIKAQEKCYDRSCIKTCGLQNWLNNTEDFLQPCLKNGMTKKLFSTKPEGVGPLDLYGFLSGVKSTIEKTEYKNETVLKENCPNCKLKSEVTGDLKTISPKRSCEEEYKRFLKRRAKVQRRFGKSTPQHMHNKRTPPPRWKKFAV